MVTGFMRSMLLATAFVCGLAQSARSNEVPLTYQPFPEEPTEGILPLFGYASQTVSTTPPDGNWKLPESVSRPLYCLITLGDMKRLAVLDRQSATDVFFTRIYFDKNGNGDLTDDPPLDGRLDTNATDDFCFAQFPRVDIIVDVNGKPLPYCIQPSLETPSSKRFSEALRGPRLDPEEIKYLVQLTVYIRCVYVGAFATDKRTYHVALGDRNGNTRFDDRIAQARPFPSKDRRGSLARGDPQPVYYKGDALLVSLSEDFKDSDAFTLGDLLWLEDKLYEVSVDIAGGRMTLTPATAQLMPLKLAAECDSLSIVSTDLSRCVMMLRPGGKARVPRGEYRLVAYQILRKDAQGDLWRIRAKAGQDSPVASVGGKRNPSIVLGEPFTPTVYVPESSRDKLDLGGSVADLALVVCGAGNEIVVDLSHVSGTESQIALSKTRTSRPKEAIYRVITPEGETVAQGAFEYG